MNKFVCRHPACLKEVDRGYFCPNHYCSVPGCHGGKYTGEGGMCFYHSKYGVDLDKR